MGQGCGQGRVLSTCRPGGLGDLGTPPPSTLSLMAAFSSFPDELPYLKCPLHTVLRLTPVAVVSPTFIHGKACAYCVHNRIWGVSQVEGAEMSGITHHSRSGAPGILHPHPQTSAVHLET